VTTRPSSEKPPGPVAMMRKALQMHRRLFIAATDGGVSSMTALFAMRAIQAKPWLSQRDITIATGIDRSTLTVTLKHLETLGYAEIAPGSDKRTNRLRLTIPGGRALKRAERAFEEAEAHLMQAFPPGHHMIFLHALGKMANAANIISNKKDAPRHVKNR
jgi:DNA-binding MarR family transcriptional regulator